MRDYGISTRGWWRERTACRSSFTPTAPARAIPGRAAGARSCKFGDTEKELKGGEAHTTNNRMELMAAISALEALKKPCTRRSLHRQPVCPAGHHRLDPRLEEERLAHRRQEAGQERRTLAAARRRAEAAPGALALGQGPRRPRRKRTRRSTGARRRRDGAVEGVEAISRLHITHAQATGAKRRCDPSLLESPRLWHASLQLAMTVQLTAARAAYRRRRPRPCRAPARG